PAPRDPGSRAAEGCTGRCRAACLDSTAQRPTGAAEQMKGAARPLVTPAAAEAAHPGLLQRLPPCAPPGWLPLALRRARAVAARFRTRCERATPAGSPAASG